jgi:hypothetical protein
MNLFELPMKAIATVVTEQDFKGSKRSEPVHYNFLHHKFLYETVRRGVGTVNICLTLRAI